VEEIRRYGEVWVINPGSPTFPHNLTAQLGTVGLLQLEPDGPAHVAIYDLQTLKPLPNLSVTL
jgi:predicted phosphodiesterase